MLGLYTTGPRNWNLNILAKYELTINQLFMQGQVSNTCI